MVACIELPAGSFWPATLCLLAGHPVPKGAQEANRSRRTTQMSWMHMQEHNMTRKGREGEQRPPDPGWKAAAMEPPRCVRTQVLQAGGAESCRGRLWGSALSPARRSPGSSRAWVTPSLSYARNSPRKGREGGRRGGGGGRGSDPSPHLAFLLPELFWWEPLLSSCAPPSPPPLHSG